MPEAEIGLTTMIDLVDLERDQIDLAVQWGYGDRKDALSHLQSGSRVDVLFTDINLPGEMDGAVLAENARKTNPTLSVIYASGRWGLLDKLRGLPNAKTLQKPYSPARACEAVESLAASRVNAARDPKPAAELALAL